MRPPALLGVLLSLSVLGVGCAELEEQGSSSSPLEAVDAVPAAFAPPEHVASCVEQIKFGAFTGDVVWAQVWNNVGQTDEGASAHCTQLGTDNPAELAGIHDGWLQTQAFLAAAAQADEAPQAAAPACNSNYEGCVPIASDVDCEGGEGDGPAYVAGPLRVLDSDPYGLDHDGDGWAC